MEHFEPQIIVFCCHNSVYSEDKPRNEERLQTAPNIKVIEMPCGGKTEVLYLMKSFESGADGVCVITCPEGECHFLEGNLRAKERVKYTKKLLNEISLESDRLQIYQLPAKKRDEFTRVVGEMVDRIKRIGKSPIPKTE